MGLYLCDVKEKTRKGYPSGGDKTGKEWKVFQPNKWVKVEKADHQRACKQKERNGQGRRPGSTIRCKSRWNSRTKPQPVPKLEKAAADGPRTEK